MTFSKFDNPELVSDAVCTIEERTRTLTVLAKYPIELPGLSFALVPSFEILGDKLMVDGEEIRSREDTIQFDAVFGAQNKTITVLWGEESTDYNLSIVFAEDPDSIRSITDFRFLRGENQGIAEDAVASIVNNGDTGTITIQVFYSGAKPAHLVPRFISPGNVSVNGVTQDSGGASRDFSVPYEYRVVSRNGQFSRTYMVKTEFISLTQDAPRMLSFSFPQALNSGLVQDAVGEINDGAGLINVLVRYGGGFATETLIPDFTAQGTVTMSGSVQIAGSSVQDFSRRIKYTITNPLNPILKRDYWVECNFIRDVSSDANITSFGFYPEDNIGLLDSLPARIDQEIGRIGLIAPVGSGVTGRPMVPRFSATGQVSIEGTLQYSGFSGRVFDEPVVYTVVSANGLSRREYTVDVRELGTTIYVNPNASGQNNGLNWNDAYISLKEACEAAEMFPREIPKEIWIASGTYYPGDTTDEYFTVAPNTSFIGGFGGWETAKSQRNVAANPVVISGNISKRYPNDIHAAFFSRMVLLDGEDVRFEDIEFRDFMLNQKTSPSFIYNPILIRWNSRSTGSLTVLNCRFVDVNGPCIETFNGNASLQNVTAERVAAMYHNSKAVNERNLLTVDEFDKIRISSQIASGNSGYDPLFVLYGGEYAASNIMLYDIEMDNVSLGWQIYAASAVVTANNIKARNMTTVDRQDGEKGSVLEIDGSGRLSLSNVNIENITNGRSFIGTIFISEPRGNVILDTITVKNVTVTEGDEYGGAGGVVVNWMRSNPVNRGNRVEARNLRLENIDQCFLPALGIYKPGAVVYLDDITVMCNAKPYTYDRFEFLFSDKAWGCALIEGYQNLTVNRMTIEETGDDDNKLGSGFSSSNSFADIRDITAKNTTLEVKGADSTVNVRGYTNTAAGHLIINSARGKVDLKTIRLSNGQIYTTGNSSEITADDIVTPDYQSNSYRTLSLSNATINGRLYLFGSSTETTNLSHVTMRDLDSSENVILHISSPGNLTVRDSTLISRHRTHSYTSTTAQGSAKYSSLGDIDWPYNDNVYYALFDNCTFDFYVAPPIITGSYNYNTRHYHIVATGNSGNAIEPNRYSGRVNMEIRNSTFIMNPNSDPYAGAIRVNYGTNYNTGSTLTLNNVSFRNYSTNSNFRLLQLNGNYSYRVTTTSSFNGNLLNTTANQTTFSNLAERNASANITFY